MKIQTVVATVNYGQIKEGLRYKLLEVGSDWYKVQVRGRAIYAFRWIFE